MTPNRILANITALLAGLLLFAAPLAADEHGEAPDGPLLTALLHSFLAGASRDDLEAHNRFWSDRLVYTSSAGERYGKAEILAGVEKGEGGARSVYSAEDIRIQQYGDTAVVAFRLVARPLAPGGETVSYFNTGTFAREDGLWRAVAWQATRIPDAG